MDNYNPPNVIKYKKFWIYDNFFVCARKWTILNRRESFEKFQFFNKLGIFTIHSNIFYS